MITDDFASDRSLDLIEIEAPDALTVRVEGSKSSWERPAEIANAWLLDPSGARITNEPQTLYNVPERYFVVPIFRSEREGGNTPTWGFYEDSGHRIAFQHSGGTAKSLFIGRCDLDIEKLAGFEKPSERVLSRFAAVPRQTNRISDISPALIQKRIWLLMEHRFWPSLFKPVIIQANDENITQIYDRDNPGAFA